MIMFIFYVAFSLNKNTNNTKINLTNNTNAYKIMMENKTETYCSKNTQDPIYK